MRAKLKAHRVLLDNCQTLCKSMVPSLPPRGGDLARLPPVRVVLVRHSKSCSNLAREKAPLSEQTRHDSTHPAVVESQNLRDPPLTHEGVVYADGYRRQFRRRLEREGFDVAGACVGSSSLLRARQTAKLLFPNKETVIFGDLGEVGAHPENTPTGKAYTLPNWESFRKELASFAARFGIYDFVVVAHGSFMKGILEGLLGGKSPRIPNLSGFMLTCSIEEESLAVRQVRRLSHPEPGVFDNAGAKDFCPTQGETRSRHNKTRQELYNSGAVTAV